MKGRPTSSALTSSLRLFVSSSLTAFPVERLKAQLRPFKLHWFPTVGSTNSKAIELRRAKKLFAPAIVLTARQTAGRGRGTNRWHAPRGVLTVTFAIPASDQIDPHHVPLIAGLAVRDACAELGAPGVGLKWPNDLWHDDRKLAGLLCERVDGVDLIGVGLNVLLNDAEMPAQLRGKVTSLEACQTHPFEGGCPQPPVASATSTKSIRRARDSKRGSQHHPSPAAGDSRPPGALSGVSPTSALLAIARHLDRLLIRHEQTVTSLLQRYATHLVLTGRRVRVSDPLDGTSVVGECAGIDRVGRLVLAIDGAKRSFTTGSVTLAS